MIETNQGNESLAATSIVCNLIVGRPFSAFKQNTLSKWSGSLVEMASRLHVIKLFNYIKLPTQYMCEVYTKEHITTNS